MILDNIIKSQDQFFITDFEFAALGYRGIEQLPVIEQRINQVC